MRDAFPDPGDGIARTGITCQHCRLPTTLTVKGVFHNPERGTQQRFCSPACRQAAYRRRLAGVPETTAPQRQGGRDRALKHQDQ